jgi:hypothetical protein
MIEKFKNLSNRVKSIIYLMLYVWIGIPLSSTVISKEFKVLAFCAIFTMVCLCIGILGYLINSFEEGD